MFVLIWNWKQRALARVLFKACVVLSFAEMCQNITVWSVSPSFTGALPPLTIHQNFLLAI